MAYQRKLQPLKERTSGVVCPTSWSRTRFEHLLKSVNFLGKSAICLETFSERSLNAIEACGIQRFSALQNRLQCGIVSLNTTHHYSSLSLDPHPEVRTL